MARKWGKIVSITALVVIVITGIVVGVLFAVGVLHVHKSGSSPTPPSPTPPGPFTPIVTCNEIPTVQSFIKNPGGQSIRLTFTPISENCATTQMFSYIYTVKTDTHPQRSGYFSESFPASAGQIFVDVPWPTDYTRPDNPVTAISGEVWLETVNSNGTGGGQTSNKIPYTFINSP